MAEGSTAATQLGTYLKDRRMKLDQAALGRAGFADRLVGRVVTSLNMAVFLGIGIFQAASGGIIRYFQLPDGSIPEHGFRVMFAFLAAMIFAALLIYRTSSEAKPSEDATRARIG